MQCLLELTATHLHLLPYLKAVPGMACPSAALQLRVFSALPLLLLWPLQPVMLLACDQSLPLDPLLITNFLCCEE
jgi:hypothetical protein